MRIKTIWDICRSLSILKLVLGRKQIIINTFLCLGFLSVLLSGYSYAGVWRDTFDGTELNGWKRTAERNHWSPRWEVVEGFLFAKISRGANAASCGIKTADFLHWNIHEFQLDRLTVVGRKIQYLQQGWHGMGELCLFLGKRKPIPDFAVEGYIFSPEETSSVTFSTKNDYNRGRTRAWYGDKFPFTTRHLKVVFDSGQFQLFTNSVLLTEFVDKHFTEIDVVGLLVTCHIGGEWFGASISSFSVSGSGIPDHNLAVQLQKTQLTTTWGELKRYE